MGSAFHGVPRFAHAILVQRPRCSLVTPRLCLSPSESDANVTRWRKFQAREKELKSLPEEVLMELAAEAGAYPQSEWNRPALRHPLVRVVLDMVPASDDVQEKLGELVVKVGGRLFLILEHNTVSRTFICFKNISGATQALQLTA